MEGKMKIINDGNKDTTKTKGECEGKFCLDYVYPENESLKVIQCKKFCFIGYSASDTTKTGGPK